MVTSFSSYKVLAVATIFLISSKISKFSGSVPRRSSELFEFQRVSHLFSCLEAHGGVVDGGLWTGGDALQVVTRITVNA